MNMQRFHYILLVVSVLVSFVAIAKELKQKRQSISSTLEKPKTSAEDFFVSEPTLTLAQADYLSFDFEKSPTTEIGRAAYNPLVTIAQEQPTKTAQEQPTKTAQELAITLTEQTMGYQLPSELEQRTELAQKEFEKMQAAPQEKEHIELQFQDADLQTFVEQIADIFNVTFISDDAIDPMPKGTTDAPTKALKGNKITFKTSQPVTKQEAWNIFIAFLNISGFGIQQQPDPSIYRIQTIKANQRSAIATFIGVDADTLPNNDEQVRYLYFIENASIESLKPIVTALQSSTAAPPIFLADQKAMLLADSAYNIKALMAIVKELDRVTMPQAMSVLKLRQADADEVKKLYDELTQQGEGTQNGFRPFGTRKSPTALFFPESARIIAEPRTNSLILLGPADAIEKIEHFITKHVDVELEQPYSPLYTYQLRYADATAISEIMNNTARFGNDTEAGKAGGVRGHDKYLGPMSFIPEPATNKIIIKGDYNDYLITRDIIKQLDTPQPQVALDVLILSVELRDAKELGVQLRSKVPGLDGLLGQNVKFATSGLRGNADAQPVVTNPNGFGVERLLGDLVNLVTQSGPGNTVLTFGQDLFGVWGIFQALSTLTNVQVISNPFIFASNKTPAQVSVGETRRIVSAEVVTSGIREPSLTDDTAALTVNITPQINSDGMIILKLKVDLSEFTNPTDESSGTKTTKLVQTQAIVADREVLAMGGLIRDQTASNVSKVPILGDIPVLGWLFKNQAQNQIKSSLLILISTKIIAAQATSDVNEFTKDRLNLYRTELGSITQVGANQDPINRLFFADSADKAKSVGEFIFDRHEYSHRKNRQKNKQTKDSDNGNPYAPLQVAAGEEPPKRRYRGRRPKPKVIDPLPDMGPQQTLALAQASAPVTIIAAPTTQSAPVQATKHKRSRSLVSFLDTPATERVT